MADQKPPVKFISFMSKSPRNACIAIWAVLLPALALAMYSFMILEPPSGNQGGEDVFDPRTVDYDMVNAAKAWAGEQALLTSSKEEEKKKEEEAENATVAVQTTRGQSMTFIYHAADGDLFTPQKVKLMREAEQVIISDPDYSKYCLKDKSGECVKTIMSATQYFYGEKNCTKAKGGVCFNGASTEPLDHTVAMTALLNHSDKLSSYYLDLEFDKAENPTTKYSRAVIFFGYPLEGYTSKNDRKGEQDAKLGDWLMDMNKKWDDMNAKHLEADKFEVLYFSRVRSYLEDTFIGLVLQDAASAFISVLFIVFYLIYHTKSAFLGLCAFLHILLSFPIAYILYRHAFGIKEFFGLNFLGIFVILAIGADDVFVYVDAYFQSYEAEELKGRPLDERLSWVFRKAASAMFVTSFTTTAAFLATASSSLPTVSAFGIFSACLVVINYIMVISYYPAIITFYHLKIEGKVWTCCCCPCVRPGPSTKPLGLLGKKKVKATAEKVDKVDKVEEGAEGAEAEEGEDATFVKKEGEEPKEDNEVNEQDDGVQKCLKGPYWRFISEKKRNNIIVVSIFVVLMIVCSIFAAKLTPATQAEQFLPEDHPLQRYFTLFASAFLATSDDRNVAVTAMYGIKTLDKGDNGKFDLADKGTVVFDDEFDLSLPAVQQYVYDQCVLARDDAKMVRSKEIACPLINFKEWLEDPTSSANFFQWIMAPDATLPVTPTFPVSDKRLFYNLLSYWFLQGGPKTNMMANYREFSGLLGLTGKLPAIEMTPKNFLMMNMTYTNVTLGLPAPMLPMLKTTNVPLVAAATVTTKYIGFDANSTLRDVYIPSSQIEPYFEDWVAFIAQGTKEATTQGLKGINPTQGAKKWIFSKTQSIYVASALSGSLISLSLAYVVLLFSTGNFVMSTLALTQLLLVVACLLGFMVMLGWELGTIESICLTVLVGLSVDYVVHLAIAYMDSKDSKRGGRVFDMLKEMGHTVVGGGLTSVGASSILFMCRIQFFHKFGWFMFLTCFLSLTFSLGFFTNMLMLIGPEGNFTQFLWKKNLNAVKPAPSPKVINVGPANPAEPEPVVLAAGEEPEE